MKNYEHNSTEAEEFLRHALPYEHMHRGDFAHDDGGSPKISFHVKQYALHFAEKQLEKERDARFRKLLGIEEKEKTS